MTMARETLSSRLGFLLLTAGCAIGLGNVWRFPFIVGEYGGAAFVLLYLLFLVILGMPVMTMELAVGRAAQRSLFGAYKTLHQSKFKWHIPGGVFFSGSVILMIYYTTVSGWLLYYTYLYLNGSMATVTPDQTKLVFDGILVSPWKNVIPMLTVVISGCLICYIGLQKGVERITKILMSGLFLLLVILSINSLTLPEAKAAMKFYLYPDFSKLTFEAIPAAMGQAFFTLSIGIGSIAIFGSYTDKSRSLSGETLQIVILDTIVALLSGCVIFPACMSYNIPANAGPGLIFESLPAVFYHMPGGRFWGILFFLFLCFAAMTTVIAVFENLIAFMVDECSWGRKKASILCLTVIGIGSLPCALGFNVLKNVQLLGKGSTILDFEDYLLSDILLPIGGLYLVLFCCLKAGWGWEKFTEEVNTGVGMKFPVGLRFYCKWILPALILALFFLGIYKRFIA